MNAPSSQPEAWLKEHKFRVTAARVAIIRLLDASEAPLTLAEIHEKIQGEGCDFATVFRFISMLEEKGLVEKIAWADGSTRHEIKSNCGGGHHHHYLICRTCQKVEPIAECIIKPFEEQIANEKGYASVSHSLQLSGVCPACQKGESDKK
jgi:Fe2+ or Zn2+ uptake regulation protein